jgi:hypothetical protein
MQFKQSTYQESCGAHLRTQCAGVPVSACQSAGDGSPLACPVTLWA